MTEMKLFQVSTVVKEYSGCKDVAFHWFKEKSSGPERPYAQLVAGWPDNCGPGDSKAYAEGYIDELFSEDEAGQLTGYLSRFAADEGVTTIDEVALPVANNCMGYGALPVGGDNDFYMLSRKKGYPLPFSVWGYYDTRHCPLVVPTKERVVEALDEISDKAAEFIKAIQRERSSIRDGDGSGAELDALARDMIALCQSYQWASTDLRAAGFEPLPDEVATDHKLLARQGHHLCPDLHGKIAELLDPLHL
jgi:hypothetical protein